MISGGGTLQTRQFCRSSGNSFLQNHQLIGIQGTGSFVHLHRQRQQKSDKCNFYHDVREDERLYDRINCSPA
jgi:hypothetical protein